jgi:hypothetical protein
MARLGFDRVRLVRQNCAASPVAVPESRVLPSVDHRSAALNLGEQGLQSEM